MEDAPPQSGMRAVVGSCCGDRVRLSSACQRDSVPRESQSVLRPGSTEGDGGERVPQCRPLSQPSKHPIRPRGDRHTPSFPALGPADPHRFQGRPWDMSAPHRGPACTEGSHHGSPRIYGVYEGAEPGFLIELACAPPSLLQPACLQKKKQHRAPRRCCFPLTRLL
ncbi:hypothetical protein VUR80DRAFT_4951 [Thermomyces stellatus]